METLICGIPVLFFDHATSHFTDALTSFTWSVSNCLLAIISNTSNILDMMDKVMKITRIISAQLHKQLLEHVRVLSEKPAVGLGKHLVHRLLGQVYQLSEEFCRKTGETQIRYWAVSRLHFFSIQVSAYVAKHPSSNTTAPRDSYIRTCKWV